MPVSRATSFIWRFTRYYIRLIRSPILIYLFIYFFSYFIFFSALIVTIRSDIETMLISRYATIFLAPIGIVLSMHGLLPISLRESISGALFGYLFLFCINYMFRYLRQIDGIGEGDFDLLLFIGSFTGIVGCWISITIGSLLGSVYGIISLLLHNNKNFEHFQYTKIPFGPFLAFGALIFVFIQTQTYSYFLLY